MAQLANTLAPAYGWASAASPGLGLVNSGIGAYTSNRPIPAPEPDPEPNPAPDAAWQSAHSCIPPADWDLLFNAIEERLETCVADAPTQAHSLALPGEHANTKSIKDAVLESVAAMKKLHTALTHERKNDPACQQCHT